MKIADGFDIWNMSNEEVVKVCREILSMFAAHSSTQQNNEWLVGQTMQVKKSGKNEQQANAVLIAGNSFATSYVLSENGGSNSDSGSTNDEDLSKNTKVRIHGRAKAISIKSTVKIKQLKNVAAMQQLGVDEYRRRYKIIRSSFETKSLSSNSLLEKQRDKNL